MGHRRALLIGAEKYGEGFAPLPAVRNDVTATSHALKNCGYDIDLVPPEIVGSPDSLGDAIRTFCRRCLPDDIHVLYFSGHGMIVENKDCIIPAGVARDDVGLLPTKRIDTDLKRLLPNPHGLFVFIIDACRDQADVPTTKSGVGWGDHQSSQQADGFIRFFGCSSGQVCGVLDSGEYQGKPVSIFSKCISDALVEGDAATLIGLQRAVNQRSSKLTGKAPQEAHLSYGEHSAAIQRILEQPIFEAAPRESMPALWEEFDGNKFHCLVIASERETKEPPSTTLEELVRSVTRGKSGPAVWTAFWDCWDGATLTSKARRSRPASYSTESVRNATVSINTALLSPDTLSAVVRALVEADLAVIDITGFEPGVMMLLGIRAACRRGVTICTHGNKWREGNPLELPFNFQDLSIASHTPPDAGVDADQFKNRFLERICNGFTQLRHQPRYLDLPAYDALRLLGPSADASATIELASRLLVLCPYEKAFFYRWVWLKNGLEDKLAESYDLRPKIYRIIDVASPQLVSQSIYEHARRTSGCVCDWSGFSPSVFLELGVRLAVSDWGVVSILDETFAAKSLDERATERSKLQQVSQLRTLFAPLTYNFDERRGELDKVAAALFDPHPQLRSGEGSSLVHDAASRAVARVQPAWPEVFLDLSNTADGLIARRQEDERPKVLFYESDSVKENTERAALERRIAAWLYMERRLGKDGLVGNEEARKLFRSLKGAIRSALEARGTPEDIKLIQYMDERMNELS
jgi:hypothetical protein